MSYILLASAAIALLLYLFFTYIIHPIFFSPLRDIPVAHPSAYISGQWIKYHRRGGSQAVKIIAAAHAKHGPIIRLAPDEISVSSYEAAHKIYIERGGFAKPKWWAEDFMTFGVHNLVSMVGGIANKEHAGRKREMGNVYSKSYVLHSERLRDIARAVLDKLVKTLDELVSGEEKGVMDVFNFNGAMNADFGSAFIFGPAGSTDFISDAKAREEYYQHHGLLFSGEPEEEKSRAWIENFALSQCNRSSAANKNAQKEAIVYTQLADRGVAGKHLASELLDHFFAGAEGPRTVLTYLQWELSKQPLLQTRLRSELLSLYSANDDEIVPDFKTLDAFPFLDAVLTETLRVYTPTPGPQHRITPPEGTTIHSHHIPGNTPISASFAVLHRNADVFPEPESWMPERWLTDDVEKRDEMGRWFWAFNRGSRTCVAKDYTIIVMKLIVATVYLRFTTEIAEDTDMQQKDRFIAEPEGEKLVLKFEKVE